MANARQSGVERAKALADHVALEAALMPPVDIRALVEMHAEIQDFQFPRHARVDAILLGLDGTTERLNLIGNDDRPLTRQRFTLSHELGHILMAWHVAHQMACNTHDADEDSADRTYTAPSEEEKALHGRELEADAFAARILLPSHFMRSILTDPIAEMLKKIETAQVSAQVGIRALCESLSNDYVFATYTRNGDRVDRWWTSEIRDSRMRSLPGIRRDEPIQFEIVEPELEESGRAFAWGRHIWWGRRRLNIPVPEGSQDWRSIESSILDEIASDEVNRLAMKRSLSGVIGSANNDFPESDPDELAARINLKVKRKPILGAFAEHPQFMDFVLARTRALIAKR